MAAIFTPQKGAVEGKSLFPAGLRVERVRTPWHHMARLSHADVSAALACAVPVLGLQAAPTAWVPTSRSLTVRPSAGDCPHSRTLAQSQEITPMQVDKVELDELWLRKLILAGPRVDGCDLCWACPVSVGFARSVTGTLL